MIGFGETQGDIEVTRAIKFRAERVLVIITEAPSIAHGFVAVGAPVAVGIGDAREFSGVCRKERTVAPGESEHFIEPGQTMLRHACRMGLEGVISKRAEAPYRSGRGRDWIKSKCTQRQEFVIAGYVPSKASRNQLGSLVLGYHEDGELKPAGRVGTGFTRNSAAALMRQKNSSATIAWRFSTTGSGRTASLRIARL